MLWGHFSPTLLWDVHSPSPRSVTRLRSGTHPLPPPFFFLCRSPLTFFLLQVHRGPPLAVPLFFTDPRPPDLLLTNAKRLDAATWFVFSFLFLFHLLTASFSFIPSCLRLRLVTLAASPPCHASPSHHVSPLVKPLSRRALPLTNAWRDAAAT
jgi:hypothetical protein